MRTDHRGESPTLKGLFAAGEAACWDLHGFNRLGGNSVAETVVAGMIVGEFIADFCERSDSDIDISTAVVRDFLGREQGRLNELLACNGTENANDLRVQMQEIMTAQVGIFRTGAELQSAVDKLQQLQERSRNMCVRFKSTGANPELVAAYRLRKMLKLALCTAYGALARIESRGAHFREDHPQRNDRDWLKRTLATWRDEGDTLPTLSYEALDVNSMELAPGWRGYGAKDYIEHPDTAQRQAQIEAIRTAGGADRHEVQARIMPYDHLLPQRLRCRNERIDEKLP